MNVPGLLPYNENDQYWNMGAQFRESYVDIKYRTAARFKPKRICEIGVWSGVAAMCFLAASPDAEYVGIDNEGLDKAWGTNYVARTEGRLRALGYKAEVIISKSDDLKELPGKFDFIHIDGDHSRGTACHDMILAWNAITPTGHILIDNGHDTGVCAGIFDAMYLLCNGLFLWEYFPDSVGNILIHRELIEARQCLNRLPGEQGSLQAS